MKEFPTFRNTPYENVQQILGAHFLTRRKATLPDTVRLSRNPVRIERHRTGCEAADEAPQGTHVAVFQGRDRGTYKKLMGARLRRAKGRWNGYGG